MIHELFVVLCFVHENKVIFKDSVNRKIEFPCVCIKYFIGGLTFPHALSLIVAILSYSTVTINAPMNKEEVLLRILKNKVFFFLVKALHLVTSKTLEIIIIHDPCVT